MPNALDTFAICRIQNKARHTKSPFLDHYRLYQFLRLGRIFAAPFTGPTLFRIAFFRRVSVRFGAKIVWN